MIELKHVSKVFETAGGRVEALKDISLTIPDGDVYGIIGMSGAGKSTLVRCINMLERPTSGEVIVNGKRLDTMSPAQLRAARRDITMIFQRFNLLMQRNCLDNVCFPMELAGVSRREAASRAQELLETVGLPDKAVAESRERIRAAFTALGLKLPAKRITVNLSPAVSSSASPLPARWRRAPRSCCATKRPARSTPRRRARSLSSSATSTKSSASRSSSSRTR